MNSKAVTKHFRSNFWRGLITIFPIVITLYIIFLIWSAAEALFSWLIHNAGLGDYYVPGLGFVLGLVIVYFIGIFVRRWFGKRCLEISENLLVKIPIVKSVYGMTRDLVHQFAAKPPNERAQPVLVQFDEFSWQMIGIAIAQDGELNQLLAQASHDVKKKRLEISKKEQLQEKDEKVMVYLPMSYQMGGFSVLISRSQLTPLNLSIEDAMRLAFTAGVSVKAPSAQEPSVDTSSTEKKEAKVA